MKKILCIFLIVVLSSCSAEDNRLDLMQSLSSNKGFSKKITKTDDFYMFSMHKGQSKTARIYIEGDGFAWRNKRTISQDPTPRNPVALNMALRDNSDLVIYVARPCQYMMKYGYSDNCNRDVWSFNRFSSKALNSINQVIDKYKESMKFDSVELVGYSGGGTIATLLATLRGDIAKITTVAGNLDTKMWTEYHGLTALDGSLNPADFKGYLAHIPQTHYIGKEDKTIPPFITYEFTRNMGSAGIIEVNTDHHNWDSLDIK